MLYAISKSQDKFALLNFIILYLKKMTKLLAIVILVYCLWSCTKTPPSSTNTEPARTKKFTLQLYQMKDYTAPNYDSTYAEVEIGAYKQSVTSTSRTYLWDTILPRQRLQFYPTATQPLVIIKSVPNIYDSKERVRVYTIIKYDSQGLHQSGGGVTPFATGADSLFVNMPL